MSHNCIRVLSLARETTTTDLHMVQEVAVRVKADRVDDEINILLQVTLEDEIHVLKAMLTQTVDRWLQHVRNRYGESIGTHVIEVDIQ